MTATKLNKRQAGYREAPHCGVCAAFLEPNVCVLVAGVIDKGSLCDQFELGTESDDGGGTHDRNREQRVGA